MTHIRRTVLVFGLLLAATASWAQVNRGTMTGIVTDPSGAVIPDVAISVINEATGVATNVTTSSAGVYTAPLLLPGVYTLTAEKEGFKKAVQKSIVVGVGDTVRVDTALAVGGRTESVTVTAQAALLQRENAMLGNIVSGQEVEELPLTSVGDQRTPASFMKLAPGVTGRGNSTGGPGGNQYMTTFGSGGSIVSSTTLKLDGADFPTNQGFEGDLRALQMPPDAIGEFNLVATNPPAEYGRSVGGTASFVMKSGSNKIHGTAFEYVRNTALNANPWFVNANDPNCDAHNRPATGSAAVNACKATYKQNEFGVTAGGAIKKDKAFIFGYYDGYRLISGNSTGTYFIPTQAMLHGDFTKDPGLPTLYDPVTQTSGFGIGPNPAADAVCGQIICRNVVSQSAIDPISAKVIPLFPNPTSSGIVDGVFTQTNWISTTSNPLSVNMWGLKGDYNVNEKNRLAVTWATGKNSTPNTASIPAPLAGGDQPSLNLTRNARVNWNLMARPNLINQVTLSLDQWNSGQQPISSYGGRNDWVSYLGLKGLAPHYGTQFPQINLGGFAYNGGGGAGINNTHSSGVDESLTWVKSKHTFKFGFQMLKAAVNSANTGRSVGWYQFNPQATGLVGDGKTGYATASFLLGHAGAVQADYIYANSYSRTGYYAGYAQDDYKLTKKLTVNLGVRWDFFSPDFQKYYHKGWIDPGVPNTSILPNLQGAFVLASPSNPYGVDTHHTNFTPRISLAYSLNNKTVIRAGYGMMYGQGNALQVSTGAYVQGFNGSFNAAASQGVTDTFVWSRDSAIPFTPSFGPATFVGGGKGTGSSGTTGDIMLRPEDGRAPYTQNFNFTIQRQLPGQMTLSAGYVGNTGIHLPSRGLAPMDKVPLQYLQYGPQFGSDGVTSLLLSPIYDPLVQASAPIAAMPIDPANGLHSPFSANPAVAGAMGFLAALGDPATGGTAIMGQALRQNPQFKGLHRYYEGLGVSNYNALQVKLDKRFSNGLTLLVSYAWSKTLTDGGSMFSTFSSEFGSTTPWNRGAQKGVSFQDIPNNLVISYIYDLPIGKGKRLLNHGGVVNAIVGGWKWSGILTYQTGLPMNFGASPSSMLGRGLFDQGHGNADQLLGVPLRDASSFGHFNPRQDKWINEAAFRLPANWTYGTMTPTTGAIRSPNYYNEDLSLMKEWNFTLIHDNPMTLRFNADFFNTFNRTIFAQSGQNGAYAAEPYVNSPGFGALGGQTNLPRQVQFALRLKW